MLHDELYRIRPDPNTFALSEAVLADGVNPLRYRSVSPRDLARRLYLACSTQVQQSAAFYVACLILTAGEEGNQLAIQRLRSKRSRNIRLNLLTTWQCLTSTELLAILLQEAAKSMESIKLAELLALALTPLRDELKLPPGNPVQYSYAISEQLLASMENGGCRQMLERVATDCKGVLYPHLFSELKRYLKSSYPEDFARPLIEKIVATKNREHLSALSIRTAKGDSGEPYVSLANTQGHILTIEGWKLIRLIEDHERPHQLAKLSEMYYQDPQSLLAFDRHKSGEIFAQLNATACTLVVICRNEKNLQQIDGRATFIVDIDYLLSVYIALKRLRDDRERFARLKEQANTAVSQDLFEQLYIPIQDKDQL